MGYTYPGGGGGGAPGATEKVTVTASAGSYYAGSYSNYTGSLSGTPSGGGTGYAYDNGSHMSPSDYYYFLNHPSAANGAQAVGMANYMLSQIPSSYSNLHDLSLYVGGALRTGSLYGSSEVAAKIFLMPDGTYVIGSPTSDGNLVSVNLGLAGDVSGGTMVGWIHTHPDGTAMPSQGDMDTTLNFAGSLPQAEYTVGGDGTVRVWMSSQAQDPQLSAIVGNTFNP